MNPRTPFLLLISISLLSCAPFPYLNDYEGLERSEAEKQIRELQLSSTSRSVVIEKLGKPLRYRQHFISYEACEDTYGVEIAWFPVYMGAMGYSTHESNLQCVEVWLDFNGHNKLKGYRLLPRDWKHNEHEEDLILKEFGKQGDPIAQKLWEQSRTYYISEDKEIVEERKERERKRYEHMTKLSTELMKLAESGDAEAQYQLFLLEDRIPFKWLCRSADQGHINARMELAYLYRSGAYRFPQDYTNSYMWYRLAGSVELRETVEKWIVKLKKKHFACTMGQACYIATQIVQLQSLLTPAGIIHAEQMLSNWHPGQCESDLMEAIPKGE